MRLTNFSITKNPTSTNAEAEWFTNKIIQFIHHDLKIGWNIVETVKVFYNELSQCSIIRLQINKEYVFDSKDRNIYFMLDYKNKSNYIYGVNLEKTISDKGSSITWIQNNEVLVFYPENRIMELLSKKIQ